MFILTMAIPYDGKPCEGHGSGPEGACSVVTECSDIAIMDKITWNESIALGFPEIDQQHRELIDIYNELCDAMEQHASSETTLRILGHLGHYTSVHFATEESLMRILNFKDYAAHKRAHDRLLAELRVLSEQAAMAPMGVNQQLMQIIGQWLRDHILKPDAKFVASLERRGLHPSVKAERAIQRWWHRFRFTRRRR